MTKDGDGVATDELLGTVGGPGRAAEVVAAQQVDLAPMKASLAIEGIDI
jgi:hypothetical protein